MRRVFAGIVVVLACAPQDDPPPTLPDDLVAQYAEARCGAMVRCDCDPSGFVDLAMCTAAMHAQYDDRVAALREQDAAYDPRCLAAVIDYWRSPEACGDPIDAAGVPYCSLVLGDRTQGEPCASMATNSFSASSCAEGLYCRGGESCDTPGPGIELAIGEPCVDVGFACIDGSYCDAATGVCAPRLGVGEACDTAAACDAQTWCAGLEVDHAGTCSVRGAPGDACDGAASWDGRACAADVDDPTIDHYCVDGTCSDRVPAACGPWL